MQVVERQRLADIRFSGNRTTAPKVMLRELPFRVGDPIDAAAIERGRQAILDLGLFKSVEASRSEGADGLIVTYAVREKFYVLPLPRVDANGDGEYAYGAQLRWNNLWGLNHTLRLAGLQREPQREGVGTETQYSFGYGAPFVMDSRWSLALGASLTERPLESSRGSYAEQFQSVQLLGFRSLSDGPPSQGWSFGTGLAWQRQDTSGVADPYGEASAPVLSLGYRDLHFRVYSEQGLLLGARLEAAQRGLASDYDYTRLNLGLARYWPFGTAEHQTLHAFGELGLTWQGPPGVNSYSLGGSSALRGYDKDFREGDAYYRLAVEWVRPLHWRWLRLALIAETGAVALQPGQLIGADMSPSIGLGLRLRLPAFVDLEVEAGIAMPLEGGAGRLFGGRV